MSWHREKIKMKRKIAAMILLAISLMTTACTGRTFGGNGIYDDQTFLDDNYGNPEDESVTERELT